MSISQVLFILEVSYVRDSGYKEQLLHGEDSWAVQQFAQKSCAVFRGFRTWLNKSLSCLVWPQNQAILWAGNWIEDLSFNLSYSVILWAFPKQSYMCLKCTTYRTELCSTDKVQKNEIGAAWTVFFKIILYQRGGFKQNIWFKRALTDFGEVWLAIY